MNSIKNYTLNNNTIIAGINETNILIITIVVNVKERKAFIVFVTPIRRNAF